MPGSVAVEVLVVDAEVSAGFRGRLKLNRCPTAVASGSAADLRGGTTGVIRSGRRSEIVERRGWLISSSA